MDIAICDEIPGLARERVLNLTVTNSVITVRELIRARIELEVERLMSEKRDKANVTHVGFSVVAEKMRRFLVIPCEAERLLNGDRGAYGPGTRAFPITDETFEPDSEAMVETALTAFARGAFFLLANDRQLIDLDEQLQIASTTEITFLKLTPLQGG